MQKQILSAFLLGLVMAMPAYAANVTGASAGVWTIPSPQPGLVVTGVGTSVLTNGQGIGSPPDSVAFTGAAFSSDFDSPFKLGTISYFNGATATGTTAETVSLGLTLTFSSPAIPSVLSNFVFNFVFTPNIGDPAASADYMYLPSAFSDSVFTIGDTTYHVVIDGFQNIVGDGFLVSDPLQLHVLEGHSAAADIYGRVVATSLPPIDVPEPAGLALMAIAVGGAVLARRKAL